MELREGAGSGLSAGHRSEDMKRDRNFLSEVEERSGQKIRLCYQCLKCFVGCPVSKYMDHNPNSVIRMIQYGMRQKVLSSRAVWLCVSCMTCGVRCPNGIDMSAVMDTLREMSQEAGLALDADSKVVQLHEEFIRSIKMWGRLHEVTFFIPYMARSLDMLSNAVSGVLLISKGKLPFIPKQIEGIEEIRKLYDAANKTKGELAREE